MKNCRLPMADGLRLAGRCRRAARTNSARTLRLAGRSTRPFASSARPSETAIGNRHWAVGFTLIELLVVISIMGLIAALAVPALKNLGKSSVQTSASRQLLDDIGRARQLAISQRTTVYMVFVTTNFFNLPCAYNTTTYPNLPAALNAIPSAPLRQTELMEMTNVIDKQLTGYNFVAYGQVGDQPGQHAWHYLSTWQSLPDGTFIAAGKFQFQNYFLSIPQWQNDYAGQIDTYWLAPGGYRVNQISGFVQEPVPFPSEAASNLLSLPCLTFDYKGRLISEADSQGNWHHAYIPLAQGSVSYGRDLNKAPQPTVVKSTDITETPPGSSSSISYTVIDVDPLSGRPKLMVHHLP